VLKKRVEYRFVFSLFCSPFVCFSSSRFIYKNHHLLSNGTRRSTKNIKNVFKTLQKTQAKSERERRKLKFLFVPSLNEIFSVSPLRCLLFFFPSRPHRLLLRRFFIIFSQFFFKKKIFVQEFLQDIFYSSLCSCRVVSREASVGCVRMTDEVLLLCKRCFHSRLPIIITFYMPS
jgi:hypothetical protein